MRSCTSNKSKLTLHGVEMTPRAASASWISNSLLEHSAQLPRQRPMLVRTASSTTRPQIESSGGCTNRGRHCQSSWNSDACRFSGSACDRRISSMTTITALAELAGESPAIGRIRSTARQPRRCWSSAHATGNIVAHLSRLFHTVEGGTVSGFPLGPCCRIHLSTRHSSSSTSSRSSFGSAVRLLPLFCRTADACPHTEAARMQVCESSSMASS
mmetsp:Transcript_44703/g.78691  ORF Transcript_44703/g.78691 Transcript_44703/m.78691 type:complete len:214 (-) Transcript_44703:456-1097(-)